MSKVLLTLKEVQKIVKDCQADLVNGDSQKAIFKGIGNGLQLKILPNQVYYYARLSSGIKLIGKFKDISLADARQQVELLKADCKKNKTSEKPIPTFKEYWNIYFDSVLKSDLSKSRKANIKSFYNSFFYLLDSYKLNEITVPLIRDLMDCDRISQTIKNRNNSLVVLNQCLNQAVNECLIESNRIANIGMIKEFKPIRATNGMKWIELEQFRTKVFDVLKNDPIRLRVFILLITLTGSRKGEILGLKWSYIDFNDHSFSEYGLITIPNSETKGRRQQNRPDHVIPITKEIYQVLTFYKKMTAYSYVGTTTSAPDYVFPSDKNPLEHVGDTTLTMPKSIVQYLDIHGIRKAISTFLYSQKTSQDFITTDLIELLLSHIQVSKIEKIYNKYEPIKELYKVICYLNKYIFDNCLDSELRELIEQNLEL